MDLQVAWFRQGLTMQVMVVPSSPVAYEALGILVISFLAHREKKQGGEHEWQVLWAGLRRLHTSASLAQCKGDWEMSPHCVPRKRQVLGLGGWVTAAATLLN